MHALLRHQAEQENRLAPNAKRVYRVMKLHGLLLQRHAGGGEERRREGRVAFALDCCDREVMGFVATTGGVRPKAGQTDITGDDVRDLMVAAVEHRFGQLNRLPSAIEWLTDTGSCYVARDIKRFTQSINLVPRTTPLESPQSNGMAEAFVCS